jgi:hypothetical protein
MALGLGAVAGASNVAWLDAGPQVSSPRGVIAGPHWVPLRPPKYQVTAGDGAFEVAVKTTSAPPVTLGFVGVMLTVGVWVLPPLGCVAMHPTIDSKPTNKTIARYPAGSLKFSNGTLGRTQKL